MTKNRKIEELIEWCIDYTLYMKEHNFDTKEINKLERRSNSSQKHSIQHKAKDGIKLPEPPKGKSALC